ncbi:MAG: matrixin family metalloprotease [Syntrophobacterales bacterium]|jgi:hypothetical protein|nr:matrixin family metalloprotease [Syntrophobacterales bacterium]
MKQISRRNPFLSLLKTERGAFTLSTLVLAVILLVVLLFVYPRYSNPCGKVFTYRIGHIDERFGISPGEFSRLTKKAADIWSVPFSRDLFQETPDGKIVIEMVYDHRQDASEKMKRINVDVKAGRDSYEGWKRHYDELKGDYERKRGPLERDMAEHRRRVQAFQAENEAGRRRGGVSEEAYRRLQREMSALNAMSADLQRRQDDLNQIANMMNQLSSMINSIAIKHQSDVEDYRKEGGRLGEKFGKGLYQRKGFKESITIYQYAGKRDLVQVLAHEFGHALGIGHVDDPNALMYYLAHEGKLTDKLSPADIAALRVRCKK